MLLTALEKHIPSARLLLQEALSSDEMSYEEKEIDLGLCEFLCVFGVSARIYEQVRPWLDEDPVRRLVFIEDQACSLSALLKEDDAPLLLNDRRVKIRFLETPLQIGPLAKRTAWEAVFRKLKFVSLKESETANTFGKSLENAHLAADLLLSDASDWHYTALKNARKNNRPFKEGLELRGKFKNIPAVIVGAGPSLRKNGHLLRSLENRALIFAGGAALNTLECEPHFAASIDKEAPCRQFKTHPFSQTPFFYQSRMNPDNYALIHGEPLLFPDGSADALHWISGHEEPFNGGWTVGNFLASAAFHLGCNPIVFVGMDFCYETGDKYARTDAPLPEGLISAEGRGGSLVWTQRDWAMAARWMEDFAEAHPRTEFIDATEGGLGFKAPIASASLTETMKTFSSSKDLRGLTHAAVQSLSWRSPSEKWREWEESLQRSGKILAAFELEPLQEEVVYQKLLAPLLSIWKPVFERELDVDAHSLSREEKIKLHQTLFFQQIVQEHLHG